MKIAFVAVVGALASTPSSTFAFAQNQSLASTEQPSVGDIFDAPTTLEPDSFEWRFRGWQYAGRGEAIGTGRFVIFTRGRSFLIAATEVVTPSTGVGHDGIQRIRAIKLVSQDPNETQAVTCDFVTLSPALAFYTGNIARGFFVVGEEITERRWFTNGDCYDDPD